MKTHHYKKINLPVFFSYFVLIQVGLIPQAFAATKTDFDGKWSAEVNCARNPANDAEKFSYKIKANVKNGQLEASRSVKSQDELLTETWSGTLSAEGALITASGTRGRVAWTYVFSGKMSDEESGSLPGQMIDRNKKKLRDCSIVLSQDESASPQQKKAQTNPAAAKPITIEPNKPNPPPIAVAQAPAPSAQAPAQVQSRPAVPAPSAPAPAASAPAPAAPAPAAPVAQAAPVAPAVVAQAPAASASAPTPARPAAPPAQAAPTPAPSAPAPVPAALAPAPAAPVAQAAPVAPAVVAQAPAPSASAPTPPRPAAPPAQAAPTPSAPAPKAPAPKAPAPAAPAPVASAPVASAPVSAPASPTPAAPSAITQAPAVAAATAVAAAAAPLITTGPSAAPVVNSSPNVQAPSQNLQIVQLPPASAPAPSPSQAPAPVQAPALAAPAPSAAPAAQAPVNSASSATAAPKQETSQSVNIKIDGAPAANTADVERLRLEAEQYRKATENARQEATRLRTEITKAGTNQNQAIQTELNRLSGEVARTRTASEEARRESDRLRQQAMSENKSTTDRLAMDLGRAQAELEASRKELEAQQQELMRLRTDVANQLAQNQQAITKNANEIEGVKQVQDADRQNAADANAATNQRVGRLESVVGSIVLPITEKPEGWIMRIAAVPIQQQQFCRIVDKFHDDLDQVTKARNDIRTNVLFRDRQADLAALLPNGGFENWLVKVVEVTQAPDGSAAILLQPPCRVMLGSDACRRDGAPIRATIPANSTIFRELSRISTGDFVAVSGTIQYATQEQKDRPLPEYALFRPGSHCSQSDGARQEEVFVTQIRYLIQLR